MRCGKVIRTTGEHPIWVYDKGWINARELQPGDRLSSHDGQWVSVEEVYDTGEYETVYNLQVAEYHTYFVGCEGWAFPGQCGTKPASAVGAESPGIL
jgi:intein/homing endonuclease